MGFRIRPGRDAANCEFLALAVPNACMATWSRPPSFPVDACMHRLWPCMECVQAGERWALGRRGKTWCHGNQEWGAPQEHPDACMHAWPGLASHGVVACWGTGVGGRLEGRLEVSGRGKPLVSWCLSAWAGRCVPRQQCLRMHCSLPLDERKVNRDRDGPAASLRCGGQVVDRSDGQHASLGRCRGLRS